ncbi:expressed protein, partial [Phakopsora pachyrhizi]
MWSISWLVSTIKTFYLSIYSPSVFLKYSTASRRFYKGNNAQVFLYLARAWYQKASKDKSFLSIVPRRS